MNRIDFRPLTRDDFPLLATWLSEPLVKRWWNHDHSAEAVERDFGAAVDGAEPTDLFLTLLDGRPFGLIQRYAIDAYPEYVDELGGICDVPPGALSIDYLIGASDLRGRGLGARMIAAFIARSWEERPEAADVIVPVCAANVASWQALERAGLIRIAEGELEPDNPIDDRAHVLYAARRS